MGFEIIVIVIKVLVTETALSFDHQYEKHNQKRSLEVDRPIMFGGMYRKIVIHNKYLT